MNFLARSLLILIWVAAPALAEKRVALVIGNGAYAHAPALVNPKNDAEGIAAALKRLGFDVLSGTDLDKQGMDRLLEAYERKLDGADVAFFFYAGHGLQVNGRNFLVPIDAKLEREAQLNFQAVSIDLVQQLMEQAQRTNIIVLDACRDNPLARTLARAMGARSTAIGNGLAQAQGGSGTLIVYATQPGNVALDGAGRNSPFTQALLEHIETPGLEVRQVLTRVRASVTKATGGKQLPWEATSLIGDFYFKAAAPSPPTPTEPPKTSAEMEALFWQSIRNSKSAGDFKAYLDRWPNGVFAPLAKARIADIERGAAEESKRAEEQRKKSAEEQKADTERKARDESRQEAERKRNQADAIARIAGQRLDQARAALRQNQFLDARRLAEESAALAKEAGALSTASVQAQTAAREVEAFRRDLDKRIEARAAVLVREARGFIAAKKFAEAEKRLVEAERLASASTVAARRELEAAEGRAEAEAKRKAEEEKKRADEAKPAAPDPKKQAQIANSFYAPDRKRGLIAFAHKKATLEAVAIAALARLAASLQGQKDYKITLVAAADRSEGTPAEIQALSRARLAAIQQWLASNGAASTSLRTGIGPARSEGPEHRIVSIAFESAAPEKKAEKPAPSKPSPGTPPAELILHLTGAEWRGSVPSEGLAPVAPVRGDYALIIRFHAGGRLALLGSAVGVSTQRFGAVDDTGTWSESGGRICASFSKIDQGQQRCYAASIDENGRVTLAGAGLLAGKRFSK